MENLNKLKKIIIITIILIVFLLIVLLIYINTRNQQDGSNIVTKVVNNNDIEDMDTINYRDEQENKNDEQKSKKIELTSYILVKNKINAYLNNIYDGNSNEILDVLNKKYKEENNINKDNVFEKIERIDVYSEIAIQSIQEKIKDGNLLYIVNGKLTAEEDAVYNEQTGQWELIEAGTIADKELNYIIRFDFENSTYDIEPIESANNVEYDINISIEANDTNVFEYEPMENIDKMNYYLSDFKEKIADNKIEEVYNLLDEQYKKMKYPEFEQFNQYIQENKEIIQSKMYAVKYKVEQKEDYTEYTFIDPNNNYYIIREYEAMDYKLILDTYTIETAEITEKYKNSTDREKIGININKFFSAINQKDYTYAYNTLYSEFKNNYYKTQEEFENFIRSNLYNQNEVTFDAFNQEGNTYIYKIIVKNKEDASQTKNMTVVMQLQGETDFTMSFSMQ